MFFQNPHTDRTLCNMNVSNTQVAKTAFQNPHTDRTLCNCILKRAAQELLKLSESPHGSNPLQFVYTKPARDMAMATFRIPTRIDPSAISSCNGCVASPCVFQNPHTDRTLCNLPPLHHHVCSCYFQNPHTDRTLCNRIVK